MFFNPYRQHRPAVRQARSSHPLAAFLNVTACAPRPVSGIPSNALSASTQIRAAIRTALVSGKRRVCVDLLLAAIDPRSRLYDDGAAETVFHSLASSIHAVLPTLPDTGGLRVVVANPSAAIRARKWASARGVPVSVAVLGIDAGRDIVTDDADNDINAEANQYAGGALLMLCPPADPKRVAETRRELQAAHDAGVPVIVHNHPREEAVYQSLGYSGFVSRELWQYDTAYLVAPFAIDGRAAAQMRGGDGSEGSEGSDETPVRFVFMRQFPDKWQLWRFVGESGGRSIEFGDTEGGDYVMCRQYPERPTDESLMKAIRSALP